MNTSFHIDLYTLTDNRNKETIENFLNEYTERKSVEQTRDCELAILKKRQPKTELISEDHYVYIKSETLTDSIDIGLSDPLNCFTVYLNSKKTEIKSVIITFTEDGKLIFGLSINEYTDENETIDNYDLAQKLCDELEKNNCGRGGYFGVETPPALNETAFFEEVELYKKSKKP